MTTKQQCPEFPFFGANYPDATCIDGYLYDLDYCDEQGNLYDKGERIPCPFCNKKEFMETYCNEDTELYESILNWLKLNDPEFYENIDKS